GVALILQELQAVGSIVMGGGVLAIQTPAKFVDAVDLLAGFIAPDVVVKMRVAVDAAVVGLHQAAVGVIAITDVLALFRYQNRPRFVCFRRLSFSKIHNSRPDPVFCFTLVPFWVVAAE